MVRGRRAAAGLIALGVVAAGTTYSQALERRPNGGMLVIAHRGAPVYAGESNLASYQKAADLGADLLEGDLVISSDGQLFLCHDIELTRVTNVENMPEYAGKLQTRYLGGTDYSGFWADSFTAAEMRNLGLLSLQELIGFAQQRGTSLYIEIKESPYFLSQGLDPVAAMASLLHATGEDRRDSRVWVQSSNADDLKALRPQVGNKLVFLTRAVTPAEVGLFPQFRAFADVLAVPTGRARRDLVEQAHAADLGVHVWTLRGSRDAYRKAAAIGADGVITDFPDLGVDVRNGWRLGGRPTEVVSKVENGNAVVSWKLIPNSWYAVTFDFGDPLNAPTVWTNQGSASYPMAEAKRAEITVARFDGARLGADAFTRAALQPPAYDSPRVTTRVGSVNAVVSSDGKTRISGSLFKLRGKQWVPLRNTRAWVHGSGDDGTDIRRNFRSDKRGEFFLTVKMRADLIAGYIPQRSWKIGVIGSKLLKPSASDWVDSQEGPPPSAKPKRSSRVAEFLVRDVVVKVRH